MDKLPDLTYREADALQRTIQEQRTRIAELDRGKAWLEEQWVAWKEIAEEREKSIQELKAWIDQLEAGRDWLEKDRRYWKGLAGERRIGIVGLALRAVRRLFTGAKKEESSNLAAAPDGDSGPPGIGHSSPSAVRWVKTMACRLTGITLRSSWKSIRRMFRGVFSRSVTIPTLFGMAARELKRARC